MRVLVLCFVCGAVARVSVETRLRMLEERVILDSIEFRESIADIKSQLNATVATVRHLPSCDCKSSDAPKQMSEISTTKSAVLNGVKTLKTFVHNEIDQISSTVKALINRLNNIEHRMSEETTFVIQLQANLAKVMEEHTDQKDTLTTIENTLESIRNNIAEQSKHIEEIETEFRNKMVMLMKTVFKEYSEHTVSCYKDSCYYYSFAQRMSWENAKIECERFKAHLAIIDNEKENEFLRDLAKDNLSSALGVWIGGSDAAEEGVWTWVNGDTITKTFWAKSEPNGGRGENS